MLKSIGVDLDFDKVHRCTNTRYHNKITFHDILQPLHPIMLHALNHDPYRTWRDSNKVLKSTGVDLDFDKARDDMGNRRTRNKITTRSLILCKKTQATKMNGNLRPLALNYEIFKLN